MAWLSAQLRNITASKKHYTFRSTPNLLDDCVDGGGTGTFTRIYDDNEVGIF